MTTDASRYERTAQQLLRHARGARSQVAFSRRLGFKSNVVARWESGQRYPTAAQGLAALRVGGLEVDLALSRLHPDGRGAEVETDADLAAWQSELLGTATQQEVAERAGVSPSQLSRWLSGKSRQRLPDFLCALDALTGMLTSFVHEVAGLEVVPAVLDTDPQRTYSAGEVALAHPIASILTLLLRSRAYKLLPAHLPGWLADHAGVELHVVHETLAAMERAGLIAWSDDRYVSVAPPSLAYVDLDSDQIQRLREEQLTAIARRPRTGAPIGPRDSFALLQLVCTEAQLDEIRGIVMKAFRDARMYMQQQPDEDGELACVVTLDVLTLG